MAVIVDNNKIPLQNRDLPWRSTLSRDAYVKRGRGSKLAYNRIQ